MRKGSFRYTKKNTKKRNYTRRKRGGGMFDFFFKQRPSPEKTREFIERFNEYIKEIVDLQSAKKVLFKEKDKKKNTEELLKKTKELIQHIKNVSDEVDKNVKIDDIRADIVGGLPAYIIARTIEDKAERNTLLDSLTEKGFNHNQRFLDTIIKNIDIRRQNEINEEQLAKQEREKTIKEAKRKQEEEDLEYRKKLEAEQEEKRKMREEEQKKKDEEEKQRKLQEAEQKKREAAEQQRKKREEEDKQKLELEANKERIRKEKEQKEKEQAKKLEKNLKLLKQEKEDSKTIRKNEPVKIVSSELIRSNYEKHLKQIRELQKAEEDSDKPQTNTVIVEASSEKPVEKVEPEEKRTKNEPSEYWIKYFPNEELYIFRDNMLSMLEDIPLLYQNTTHSFPSFTLDIKNNKYINALINDTRNIRGEDIELYVSNYATLICFVLFYIGIITNIMLKHNCYLMLKGGKAIQLNCFEAYESNDIDILILSDDKDKKEIALEIGKLLIWILSEQSYIDKISMIETGIGEPIIKLSAKTVKGYEAIVDIGFNTPKEEIKSYVLSYEKKIPRVNVPFKSVYQLAYISQTVDAMIKEKLYYYLKYVILKNYTPEDNVNIFIPKIYRSLKALLKCKYSNPTAHKKILTEMVDSILKDKEEYLKGVLEIKTIPEIVEEMIANIQ